MAEKLYTEFRKLTPKATGGLVRMRQETFRDAAVAAKYKILAALAKAALAARQYLLDLRRKREVAICV